MWQVLRRRGLITLEVFGLNASDSTADANADTTAAAASN